MRRGYFIAAVALLCAGVPGCESIKARFRKEPAAQKADEAGKGDKAEASAKGDKGEHDKAEAGAKGEHDKAEAGAKGEHDKAEHDKADKAEHDKTDKAEHDKADKVAQSGSSGADVDEDYVPRVTRPVDEEECDGVAREELERLRSLRRRLGEREAALRTSEEGLKKKGDEVRAAQVQIDQSLKDLQRLRGELDARLSKLAAPAAAPPASPAEAPPAPLIDDKARADKVKSLSAVIGHMSPARAAGVLGAMADKEDPLAAAVLSQLPEDQAGRVLGQMKPEVAARLAERLGGVRPERAQN